MKIVTAACAIENIPDIYSRTFECDGKYETSDGTVICNGVHGTVSFQKAMNESCNCAFAEITLELGAGQAPRHRRIHGLQLKALRQGSAPD